MATDTNTAVSEGVLETPVETVKKLTDFRVGDTIRVHAKIKENDKTRIQVFEGVVISINKTSKTFTIRKTSEGVGVERIWRFDSPWIEKIEIKRTAKKIRRAKLYYLRGLTPKEVARIVS